MCVISRDNAGGWFENMEIFMRQNPITPLRYTRYGLALLVNSRIIGTAGLTFGAKRGWPFQYILLKLARYLL